MNNLADILDKSGMEAHLQCNILHCTRGPAMITAISSWIERAFAPAIELLGNLPPSAVTRLFAPF